MRFSSLALLQCAVMFMASVLPAQSPASLDLVIEHGHIIDGTGSPWYAADLGIREGHIAAIGDLHGMARRDTIDAGGKVVAPGFIDMVGQSEQAILADPRLPSKIFQGVTTEITGEGTSIAPLNDAIYRANRSSYDQLGIKPDWTDFRGYFQHLERQHIGINIGSFVGATTIREMVLGMDDVQPSQDQIVRMQDVVRRAMRDGAMGVSTALMYAPAPYAKTPELISLATAASGLGGVYATHIRTEGAAEPKALDEAFTIGRESHIPVVIWHLKVAGKENWGNMPKIVAQIDAARLHGIDVSANVYAYTAWANDLSAFLPPWAHDGGNDRMLERLRDPKQRRLIRSAMLTPDSSWDNEWQEVPGPEAILIAVTSTAELASLQGKRLSEIAAQWHSDPIDALFDLLLKDNGNTEVAVFGMSEADNVLALRQPWVSIGTDWSGAAETGVLSHGHPHPRAFGTFPRILHTYVAQEKVLTLPDSIRKFTSLPAAQMRLVDRGVLKKGMWAVRGCIRSKHDPRHCNL